MTWVEAKRVTLILITQYRVLTFYDVASTETYFSGSKTTRVIYECQTTKSSSTEEIPKIESICEEIALIFLFINMRQLIRIIMEMVKIFYSFKIVT